MSKILKVLKIRENSQHCFHILFLYSLIIKSISIYNGHMSVETTDLNLCNTEIMQVELSRKINEQALWGKPVHKADTSCAPSVSSQILEGIKK